MQRTILSLALLAFAACSNNNGGGNDGGTNDGPAQGDGPSNGVHQTGQIVNYGSTNTPVSGASVTDGTSVATTDSKGNYSLTVAKDTPYTMTVSNDGYLTLHEQEWKLSGDADRGQTDAVPNLTENLLKGTLNPAPDTQLGVLTIEVIATGSCTSATGATLSVPGLAADGGTGAHLYYFDGGSPNLPSSSATSVTDGALPSAIIWDLPVGTFSQITVTHPTCTAVAFPFADPNIPTLTYTGNSEVTASSVAVDDAGTMGNVASFMRVYLK